MGKRFEQIFHLKGIGISNKHVKRSSASLVIRELQIKSMMRHHFLPTRTAVIKKKKCTIAIGDVKKHVEKFETFT